MNGEAAAEDKVEVATTTSNKHWPQVNKNKRLLQFFVDAIALKCS